MASTDVPIAFANVCFEGAERKFRRGVGYDKRDAIKVGRMEGPDTAMLALMDFCEEEPRQ